VGEDGEGVVRLGDVEVFQEFLDGERRAPCVDGEDEADGVKVERLVAVVAFTAHVDERCAAERGSGTVRGVAAVAGAGVVENDVGHGMLLILDESSYRGLLGNL